jgi:hypothetical protein
MRERKTGKRRIAGKEVKTLEGSGSLPYPPVARFA